MAANSEWEVLSSAGDALQALCVSPDKFIHAICSETSEIYKIEVGTESGAPRAKMQVIGKTDGYVSALAFDADGAIFAGDFAAKAILSQPADSDGFVPLVSDYEGHSLKGPNTFVFSKDGTLFFTDSGPLGDSSLQNPTGSVFMISPDNRILKPLALQCLAHPSGIAVSPDGGIVYVAETLRNQIIRFVRRPGGAFQCSVFHQFSGCVGPSAVHCDHQGRLFVGRFEYAAVGSRVPGVLTVLDPSGKVVGESNCPSPQITSVLVANDAESGAEYCYVTESSGPVFYRILASNVVRG